MIQRRLRSQDRSITQSNYSAATAPLILLIGASLFAPGCATLVGSVPPVERRSTDYGYAAPSDGSTEWRRIDQPSGGAGGQDPDASDVAWQSAGTASIISLTSACRTGGEKAPEGPTLEELTGQLLQGLVESDGKTTRLRTVSGVPALETSVLGKLSGERIRMKAVVMRVGACTYDAMLVGRPERVEADEAPFERFLLSLRLR